MTTRAAIRISLIGLWIVGMANTVQAQRRSGMAASSIGVGAAIHAGGEIDFEGGAEDDLKGTIGLRVHWDKLLGGKQKGKAFLGGTLGLLGRASWWEPENFGERSTLLDLALRARFVVGFQEFVFYAGPAVGPTVLSILNDDYNNDERVRPGVNFTFVGLGFEWWWNNNHALFFEIGYAGHWLFHDNDFQLSQAMMSFGIDFGR